MNINVSDIDIIRNLNNYSYSSAVPPFRQDRIGLYCLLYILYKLEQQKSELFNKAYERPVDELIQNIECKDNIKKLLYKYAQFPKDFCESDLQFCNKFTIYNFFKFIKGFDDPAATSVHIQLLSFIKKALLRFESKDKVANFYADPKLSTFLFEGSKIQSVMSFYDSEILYAFQLLKYDIFEHDENEILQNVDLKSKEIESNEKYSKIFAFPPFFQRQTTETLSHTRTYTNMERSAEDNTEFYIKRVIDSLEDGGRATVIVSNSIFTRNYFDLQKFIIDNKYLTEIVYLPVGSINPPYVSASIFVFDKKKDNSDVIFMDLRDWNSEKETDRISNPIKNIDIEKFLKVESEDSCERPKISYERIIQNGYNLNISLYKESSQNRSDIICDEEYNPYEKAAKQFTLGDEARIFNGIHDNELIVFSDDPAIICHAKEYGLKRFLKISDIVDNRIQDTMLVLDSVKPEGEDYAMTPSDVVVSKVYPFKVAICPAGEKIYPAANFFIIRLNPDSELDSCYVKAYLESEEGQNKLLSSASGGGLRAISKGIIAKIQIPYLSKEEQQRLKKTYMEFEKEIHDLEYKLRYTRECQQHVISGHLPWM